MGSKAYVQSPLVNRVLTQLLSGAVACVPLSAILTPSRLPRKEVSTLQKFGASYCGTGRKNGLSDFSKGSVTKP